MAELTPDEVRKVARLSKLELSDAEVADAQTRLSAVLSYMDHLSTVDVSDVEPMPHIGAEANRLREDEPGPTLSAETAVSLAPESFEAVVHDTAPEGDTRDETDTPEPRTIRYIKVPKVLGDGGGA